MLKEYFKLERNNTNLVNNIKIIKEIRKLINKKIPKIDNFEIKDKSKISDRIITIDKNDYYVSTIINKFINDIFCYKNQLYFFNINNYSCLF